MRAGEKDVGDALRSDPVFAAAQVSVLVKIMVTVVLFDPRSFDTFTLPKSVAAHASSLVLAGLLVWLLARHGSGVLYWSRVHVGAGALLFAFAVATPFALDPTIALFGTFKRYLGLTQMVDNVLLYLAVGMLFRDPRSLRSLARVGIGVALPVLAYAAVQRLELDPLRFVQSSTRIPISTLGNPDITGGLVSIIGVTALGLALLLPGRPLTPARPVLALIGLACLVILYATGVRAGLLGIGAGWLTTIVLATLMPRVGRGRRAAAVGFPLLLAASLVVAPIGERLAPAALRTDQAVASRLETWTVALRAIEARPWLGLGPDNFAAFYPARRAESSIPTGELQNSTHDMWLYAATSAGLVGLVALLLVVVLLASEGWRLARAGRPAAFALIPLAAYMGQALVNVNEIALDWTFWTCAGVIAGGGALPVRVRPVRSAVPRYANALGAVAVGAAALLAVVGLFPRIAAGEAMLASEAFAGAGRGAEAVPFGEAAVAADPRRPEHWSSYGTALTAAGDRVAAIVAYGIAARQEPWHPLPWLNLAIVWRNLGNTSAAYAAAQRAVADDAYDGTAREVLSLVAYERGDYQRAAAEGVLAIRYGLPARDSAYFTTISAYVQLRDLERAEPLAREAVRRSPTAQFRLQLAAILADRGKVHEAVAVLDDLIREQPNNADAKALRDAISGR